MTAERAAIFALDPRVLRRLWWASTLALVGLFGLSTLGFLWPPERRILPDTTTGLVRDSNGSVQSALLVRNAERWVGSVHDFPPGSATHFQPQHSPGFFVVRMADGSFRAVSDRENHWGRHVQWQAPLWWTRNHRDGPKVGFWEPRSGDSYHEDGSMYMSMAPGPLNRFPLMVDGDRLSISLYCAEDQYGWWQCRR